jgi:hypothetical protein
MYEIKDEGVTNMPKRLTGTAAERAAYNTTKLAKGSKWKDIDTTTHKVTAMWEWDGANWNQWF